MKDKEPAEGEPSVSQLRIEALVWIAMLTDPDLQQGPGLARQTRRVLAFLDWFAQSLRHFRVFMEALEIAQRDSGAPDSLDCAVREAMDQSYDNVIAFRRPRQAQGSPGTTQTADGQGISSPAPGD